MADRIGFIVMETAEDYEQGLTLRTGPALPAAGILDWCARKPREAVAVFADQAAARAAIVRTEHYRLAFGRTDLPEKQFCKVVPVARVEVEGQANG